MTKHVCIRSSVVGVPGTLRAEAPADNGETTYVARPGFLSHG
jgi:hypothetical protein